MEYAYVLVTTKGCEKGIHVDLIKDLIKDSESLGLTSLISVYDLTSKDIEKLYNCTKDVELYESLRKKSTGKMIMPLFVKGFNAVSKMKQIIYKYNEFSNPDMDKSRRYLDNVYISNDTNEAILDFCEYTDVENFIKIESLLFPELNCEINKFNFKALEQSEKENKKLR